MDATQASAGIGTYFNNQPPTTLFDNSSLTKYTSRGNSSSGRNAVAGLQTGFYFTVGPCSSVLVGFVFTTYASGRERDPQNITIEGSNSMSNLDLGISWVLIYVGASGIDNTTGRETDGAYQSILNPVRYRSYRILITSKQGPLSDSVSYSEVKLFGRYIRGSIPTSGSSSLLSVIVSSAEPIWNTTVGGDSMVAVSGNIGYGTYYPGLPPSNLFDDSIITRYVTRGNSYNGTNAIAGLDTGFYVAVADCEAVLTEFSIAPERSQPTRDPITVTVEGSNGGDLTKGSNWNAVYNGATGLLTIANRSAEGQQQTITQPGSYLYYRFLVTSKRTISDYVSYTEVKLYGYHG